MSVHFDEKWLRAYCQRTGQQLPEGMQEAQGKGESAERKNAVQATGSKYGNCKTELDGRKFDSRHEAEVYRQLSLAARAGEYCAVLCQVPFYLPGGVKYIADFVTLELDGYFTVWDAKSSATARDKVYRLKKRQMRECLHIEIREV